MPRKLVHRGDSPKSGRRSPLKASMSRETTGLIDHIDLSVNRGFAEAQREFLRQTIPVSEFREAVILAVKEWLDSEGQRKLLELPLNAEWFLVSEAAAYLRVKPKTIYNWVHSGRIKSYSFSEGSKSKGRIRIRKMDLDKLMGVKK